MKNVVIILLLLIGVKQLGAQDFFIITNGIVSFNETQLEVGEAGNDISANLRSNAVYLSVNSNYYWNMNNERWRIYIHKSDINWDDQIQLTVKRTGKGQKYWGGKPYIQGGNSNVRINDNPTYFFNGKDKVLNIPVKFRVKKLSLTMGAEDFETDIVFTIYDN